MIMKVENRNLRHSQEDLLNLLLLRCPWITATVAVSILLMASPAIHEHSTVSLLTGVSAFTVSTGTLSRKQVDLRTNNIPTRRRIKRAADPDRNNVIYSTTTTKLFATIEIEKGSSASLNDDDDNDDEDEEIEDEEFEYDNDDVIIKETLADRPKYASPSSWQQQQKSKKKNRAMRDPQFLSKRTADLIKAASETMNNQNINSCVMPDTSIEECDPGLLSNGVNGNNNNNNINVIGRTMKVDKKTFHFLMDAWAFSGEDDAAEQAISLLECMEECSSKVKQPNGANGANGADGANGAFMPLLQLDPDVRSYTKTMNAIARRGDFNSGVQAEVLFQRMKANLIKPNSYTYTALIQSHANAGATFRANEVLQDLIKRFEAQYQHELHVGSMVAPSSIVQPTAKAFHAVMYAYSKAGQAEQAENVLNQMEMLYKKYGDSVLPGARPNHFHYNTLISAYANSNDGRLDSSVGAERAEQLLDRMTRYVQPTTVSYNAVIDAYAKAGLAEKAESLLRSMLNEQQDDDFNTNTIPFANGKSLYETKRNSPPKPNTRSFNSVMNAWAKSRHTDNALNAEMLLDLMKKRYEKGDQNVRPDVHSFCTVINAWARSSNNNKAERAYNLYKEMEKLFEAGNKDVRPNVVALNAVLNACAYTAADDFRTSNRAVEIAHTVLKHVETNAPAYGKPDQITYGTFLKACATQMPDSSTREKVIDVIFKMAIRDGQVGNFVLQQLQQIASDELYLELVGRRIQDPLDMEILPKSWWCHVAIEEKKKWRK